MLITTQKTFRYAGKDYDKEIDALEAAVDDLAESLAGLPKTRAKELMKTRYDDLRKALNRLHELKRLESESIINKSDAQERQKGPVRLAAVKP